MPSTQRPAGNPQRLHTGGLVVLPSQGVLGVSCLYLSHPVGGIRVSERAYRDFIWMLLGCSDPDQYQKTPDVKSRNLTPLGSLHPAGSPVARRCPELFVRACAVHASAGCLGTPARCPSWTLLCASVPIPNPLASEARLGGHA